MRACAIVGCDNNDKSQKTLRFYEFPKDFETRRAWECFCSESSTVRRFVCREHFNEDSWTLRDVTLCTPLDKRKLVPGAVPVVNVPTQPQTDREERHRIGENKSFVSIAVEEYEANMEEEQRQLAIDQMPKSVMTQTL